MLWLFATLAAAGDLHAGIRPDAVEVLDAPVYTDSGWIAPVRDEDGGSVQVFVAPEARDAEAWFEERVRALPVRPPELALGVDAAVGRAHGHVLFREGNVAVVVERPEGGAVELAERLRDAIEDASPWPDPPALHVDGRVARVDGSWAQVTWHPAPVLDPDTLLPQPVFVAPLGPGSAHLGTTPRRLEVRVWDAYGRTARVVRE